MKKVFSTTILCLSAMTQMMAQNIMGKVVDTKGEPLAFANVVLLNRQDSAFVKGVVSGEDGSFSIDSVCNGGIIKVTSVGYKTICKDCEGENVGVIKMEEDSKMLGEVVVKSSRPVIAIKGNALVTTVVNSQLSHAGTANDVLRQVPMVTGRDGNFEVFGKGVPLIYINGHVVQDKNELAQLNSQDIKNVEVITNPGAKYDASVKSVIRIRTKPSRGEGFGGTLRAQNGFRHYFSSMEQANLKYRKGGLEVFTNLNYYTGQFYSYGVTNMETKASTNWLQNIESIGRMRNNEFFGKFGLSWMLNEHHSIGAYYVNGAGLQKEYPDYPQIRNL